jgi:hypothetical protein
MFSDSRLTSVTGERYSADMHSSPRISRDLLLSGLAVVVSALVFLLLLWGISGMAGARSYQCTPAHWTGGDASVYVPMSCSWR